MNSTLTTFIQCHHLFNPKLSLPFKPTRHVLRPYFSPLSLLLTRSSRSVLGYLETVSTPLLIDTQHTSHRSDQYTQTPPCYVLFIHNCIDHPLTSRPSLYRSRPPFAVYSVIRPSASTFFNRLCRGNNHQTKRLSQRGSGGERGGT